ncbi:MAG: ROK family protein [Acidimicrobiales bacterium]
MEALCLAVDIGGTKMAAALADSNGALSGASRVPTPHGDDGEAVWAVLSELISRVAATAPSGAIGVCGVGCGGPMIQGGAAVSPLNIGAWRGFPLRDRIGALVGVPTAVDNDAKALALAEGWRGGAVGCDNYLAMVVSTGVGGGIVLDGRLLDGRLGNAGHVGHVVVEPDGRPCSCGGFGCLEAEASGSAIAAVTGRPASQAPPGVVERCGIHVGRAVASVANLLDLDLALVGGSVALGFGEPFFAAARVEIARHAGLAFSEGTAIERAGLGADGPLVGAAALGWRHLRGGPT